MEQIKIADESGDKKYFSQIPHYILNHSTAIDQALYLQMKRFAGETGKCFATQETLMKKMGVSRVSLRKSLDYLLTRGWIRFVGVTGGKTRPVKTYAIVDIWKLNILHYEEIPSRTAVSSKKEIPSQNGGDTVQVDGMIPSQTAIEEDLKNKNNQEETAKGILPLPKAKDFFNKERTDSGIPMFLQDFVLMCRGAEKRHYRIIGEHADDVKPSNTNRGEWRAFGLRNMRTARRLVPFTDRRLQEAMSKLQKDLKENGGFMHGWTLETLEKYIHK